LEKAAVLPKRMIWRRVGGAGFSSLDDEGNDQPGHASRQFQMPPRKGKSAELHREAVESNLRPAPEARFMW